MSSVTDAHAANVLRGHKATLTNPNTSTEAKEHSAQILTQADEPYDHSFDSGAGMRGRTSMDSNDSEDMHDRVVVGEDGMMVDGKNINNVVRGHKAALNNPNVSEEAKDRSRAVLEELGAY
ncbi:hypothetical protein SISNIDRAFT_470404 [Sistotremastrum niveocremeum HHB9708]|uniref:Conidiation protein 6 n=2 Tax=Sistotremastraceae TaxID=3402574 RepID=A0A164NVD5_9AGAM|nr:hypothetical protein SISNIDRAFT_470404 [Sistotremastrum niveocremeum HHB9708]KZT40498.1 hypothetical protein SISSUDRAFT_1060269 [Sistotremastrum suecicum HHB10207 ss-3]